VAEVDLTQPAEIMEAGVKSTAKPRHFQL